MADHKLVNYLITLADDHNSLASYERDPEAAMKQAGLSQAEMDVLKTRDPKKIEHAIVAMYPPDHPINTTLRPKLKITLTISISIEV